ncbi:MAG: hypothetical protein H0V66_07950 [Bdellovibrionales bacterium]|nr:hypothetical protein [Bdellovibrionales bacterium]
MKKLITLALTLTILTGQVQAQNFAAPDILIDTRLDADWSGILVTRIRRLMHNLGKADPFRQKFVEPIMVSEAKVQDYLNAPAKELLNELGHMLEMDILNAKTQVTIHGLKYDVRGFKTELNATEDKIEGLSISSDFSASKIRVSADKVTLALIMPGKKALPVINIEVIKPVIKASEDKLINFFAKIQIQNKQDKFQLLLENANFDNMVSCLMDSQDAIQMDFESIIVPRVSIKVGNKELKFDPKKIEALIISKKAGIKGLLVAEVSRFLTSGMGTDLLKEVNKVKFDKEHWIDSASIQSYLKIESFTNEQNGNIVEVEMKGDFCPPELYKAVGDKCIAQKVTQPVKSRISADNHSESIANMRSLIDNGNANIVVSISEDYVNKVLVATYDAGLWNTMLKDAGVKLGPNKVFLHMDAKGSSTGTLYMDMLYTPKKLQSMAIGAKEVRFPLAIKVALKIKQDKHVPIFVIHMQEVDTSDALLLHGKPDIGVISNIHSLRMKKKVLAALRLETAGLANKDVLELRYPELRGLGLDKVDFVSDGNGRMNALILLKDDATAEERRND